MTAAPWLDEAVEAILAAETEADLTRAVGRVLRGELPAGWAVATLEGHLSPYEWRELADAGERPNTLPQLITARRRIIRQRVAAK